MPVTSEVHLVSGASGLFMTKKDIDMATKSKAFVLHLAWYSFLHAPSQHWHGNSVCRMQPLSCLYITRAAWNGTDREGLGRSMQSGVRTTRGVLAGGMSEPRVRDQHNHTNAMEHRSTRTRGYFSRIHVQDISNYCLSVTSNILPMFLASQPQSIHIPMMDC